VDYHLLPESPYSTYQAYLEKNGASAILKARSLSPQAVVDEIRESGLRGRGGAGFPTGVKWKTVLDHPCVIRYVVCNAAEGEPGTFKDRHLLRRNPYAVLEGLLIAAHVVGAKTIHIGIKASFEPVKIGGSSVGKVFEAYVNANSIDLLVMGAYRHSRVNEIVWGGATKTVIGRPPCWVMMSH